MTVLVELQNVALEVQAGMVKAITTIAKAQIKMERQVGRLLDLLTGNRGDERNLAVNRSSARSSGEMVFVTAR